MRLLVIEFNADKYRMSRAMAEAHRRTAVLPMLQIQEAVERVARGPVQEMVSSMAEAHRRTAVLPMLQIQEAIEAAAGAQIQEMVRTLLVHRFEVRPLLDTQRMAEIAQGILESNIAGPGEPTTDGDPASAAVALPGNASLSRPCEPLAAGQELGAAGLGGLLLDGGDDCARGGSVARSARPDPTGSRADHPERAGERQDLQYHADSHHGAAVDHHDIQYHARSHHGDSRVVAEPEGGQRTPAGPALRSVEKVVTSMACRNRPLLS